MRKIVITGATSMIGIALIQAALSDPAVEKIYAVVKPDTEKRNRIPSDLRIQVIPCDVTDYGRLASYISDECEVFYHLAWNGSAGPAREDFDIQYTNIGYTAQAVRTAKECGCRKFVGAGSQAEYGVIHRKAVEAETVPHPFMMYGAAKLASYQMGRVLAGQLGISFVWPRIYSVYGPRKNDPTLLGYVARTLRAGKVPELSSCENMWDFMYITDFARAMRMLAEKPETEGIYHIASGKTGKLKHFVEQLRDAVRPGIELGFGMKQTDPNRTFWLEPDVSRLEALGFQCMTSFDNGIWNL